MSGYMKVLAEYSDKAGHKDRKGHINTFCDTYGGGDRTGNI